MVKCVNQAKKVLTTENVELKLDKEDLLIYLDGTPTSVKYKDLTIMEAMLLRIAFAQPRPSITPGQDTYVIFKALNKPKEEVSEEKATTEKATVETAPPESKL